MKKILIMALMVSLIAESKETIRITNGEWEPYLSEHSYEYGLASHIVTEAFKLENIDIEWGFYPWKRSYFNAEHGVQWDASAVWWPAEETEKTFYLSDMVVKTEHVFFYLKTKPFDWSSIEDLNELNTGVTVGYKYG